MTLSEIFAAEKLKEFVKNAKKDGLCHVGYDIDYDMQKLIINIIVEYINKCEMGASDNGE